MFLEIITFFKKCATILLPFAFMAYGTGRSSIAL